MLRERFHQSRSDVTAPAVPGRSLIANKILLVGKEDTEMPTRGAALLPRYPSIRHGVSTAPAGEPRGQTQPHRGLKSVVVTLER